MEADRTGGGSNPNSGGGGGSSGGGNTGAGRNPNGPKAAPGQATSAAATGAMAAAAAAAAGAVPGPLQPREPQDAESGMTLPGILHFIQYEWGRFQAEKYRWEAERDELRVNVFIVKPAFVAVIPSKGLEGNHRSSSNVALRMYTCPG